MAHLDDNTRTGLHALGLGVVLVGLPVLVVALIDASQTDAVTGDAQRLHIFRNGYLLPTDGPSLMTWTRSARGERIAMGCVLSIATGALLTLIPWLVGLRQQHWRIGRYAALLVLAWSCFAAVGLPAQTSSLDGSALRITTRSSLIGVPLPFTAKEKYVPLGETAMWSTRTNEHWTEVVIVSAADTVRVASTTAEDQAVELALQFLQP